MLKVIISAAVGAIAGMCLLTLVMRNAPQAIGAATPYRGFIGIYNSPSNPLTLADGSGSALAVDQAGQLIVTQP